MRRIFLVVFSFLLLSIIAVYLYIRYNYLNAKDFKPDQSKARNIVDLRPAIIAKLQQLVKDGSDGLYTLTIDKLDADILASTVDVKNASVAVDTVVLQKLDELK